MPPGAVPPVSLYPAARFLLSAAAVSQFPSDTGTEVAIAGRSNAGKSSALNAMLARRALARTSKTPGRTRLINFFEIASGQRLVDLPGYGYAAGARTERELWARLIDGLSTRSALRGLCLVVDARRGIQPADETLLRWAQELAKPVHVLLSKADQLRRAEGMALLQSSRALLGGRGDAQLFSAHAGLGMEQARTVLETWLKETPR